MIEASCSGTKNPVQLAAKANNASAAMAPATWNLCFLDNISVTSPCAPRFRFDPIFFDPIFFEPIFFYPIVPPIGMQKL